MPAFRVLLGSVQIEIHDVDHGPQHCHVVGLPRGGSGTVDLLTLEVKPASLALPRHVSRFIRERQQDLLEAWDDVVSVDRSE